MPDDEKPLAHLRIALTREAVAARVMGAMLELAGARASICPLIRLGPPESWEEVDAAIRRITIYDWVLFTSAGAVQHFIARLEAADARIDCSIGAVGLNATAEALERRGQTVALIPRVQTAEGMLEAIALQGDLSGARVLLPRGDLAKPRLKDGLQELGCEVDDPVTYCNEPDPEGASKLLRELEGQEFNAIAFTSASTVDRAIAALGDRAAKLLGNVRLYSIGPQTSGAIRAHGLEVAAEAQHHETKGLVQAIIDNESGKRKSR